MWSREAEMTVAEFAALGVEMPPTEDALPYDDGIPMRLNVVPHNWRLCWPAIRNVLVHPPSEV
jgi:hypothetical protein